MTSTATLVLLAARRQAPWRRFADVLIESGKWVYPSRDDLCHRFNQLRSWDADWTKETSDTKVGQLKAHPVEPISFWSWVVLGGSKRLCA